MSYYFFSLTTDMNRVSLNPRVSAWRRVDRQLPGVRVHKFCSWLSVNPPSSPVDGSSEER